MSTLPGLTPELDAAVRDELREGEELWYAGMPASKYLGRRMWPVALFGLFFGGFAAFWIGTAAWGVWFGGGSGKPASGLGPFILFPLAGLPFLAVGLAMVSSPFWAGRIAARTACCVTNQRVLQIQRGRSVKVRSWSPQDLEEVAKTVHSDGRGDLVFSTTFKPGAKGGVRSMPQGFYGVPEPRACEQALLALKETFRNASAPQTAA